MLRILLSQEPGSLATRLRLRRFQFFLSLLSSLPRPIRILDVGGTELFWNRMGFSGQRDVEIVLLNVEPTEVTGPNFVFQLGDARRMDYFRDREFDVAFSNSVIEHVGGYREQMQMAAEIRRVAKRYFVQTPNRFFPIEPHFMVPFFQFLPERVQVFLVTHFNVEWYERIHDHDAAIEVVRGIRLLTKRELTQLFPQARLRKEVFLGLTKSFMVHHGWGAV